MKELQILFGEEQGDADLYLGSVFPEIFRTNPVISAHCPYSVQDCGFARVVLTDQDQSIFDVLKMHVMDGFEVLDIQVRNFHGRRLLISFSFSIRHEKETVNRRLLYAVIASPPEMCYTVAQINLYGGDGFWTGKSFLTTFWSCCSTKCWIWRTVC